MIKQCLIFVSKEHTDHHMIQAEWLSVDNSRPSCTREIQSPLHSLLTKGAHFTEQ